MTGPTHDPIPARPANKKTKSNKVDPADLRRATTALCELSASSDQPMRRKVARQIVLGHLGAGRTLEEVMRWARNDWGMSDPTGVGAVWLAMRGGVNVRAK